MIEAAIENNESFDFPLPRSCPLEPADDYVLLREQRPIAKVDLPTGQTAWLVTNHADVRKLFTDPRISSDRTHPNFPLRTLIEADLRQSFSGASKALIGLDLPEHKAPRRMLVNEFTVHRLNALKPRIQQVVDELIDAMLAKGPDADLVEDLALPVPSLVICDLLGVPYSRREFFHERTQIRLLPASTAEERAVASQELRAYMDELIAEKEKTPTDDLLGRLIERNRETEVFTRDLLVGMAQLLLVAGHETTANMIALGTVGLLTRPEAADQLRADPSLAVKAVEELLRYYPIIDNLSRVAAADIEIGGVTIKAGDGVILSLASANRDEEFFDGADTFDVNRGSRHHVSFAYGVHQCLGQNLARTELEIVFTTLMRRIPTLRLAAEIDDMPFKNNGTINGLYKLPVAW
ncbi:MAG TPA: cytochrome P450 [Pseudonocardiaceae bacterium]|nr:cytochrome P450 [Pseudonocardiaceae bacterium]